MKNMLSAAEWLSKEERKSLLQKSNWRGLYEVLFSWALIIATFALVIYYPHPLTYIAAWLIMGGRQLGCSVIMHDTGHYALFKSKRLNNVIGRWFGAYPILGDLGAYRPYHNIHHVHTGTDEDPDLLLTTGYPARMISMCRKFLRDLSGMTGIKTQRAFIMMELGILKYNLGKKVEWIDSAERTPKKILYNGITNLSGPIFVNVLIFGVLWAIGHPWLYLLWIISLFTTFQLFNRIRSMAEHSLVIQSGDPHTNTRTTYANPIERLLVAPHFVNYHAEHHLMMGVPPYNLPKMHQILLKKGFYEKGISEKGYLSLIRKAVI
jgi:fatty acid desaturase